MPWSLRFYLQEVLAGPSSLPDVPTVNSTCEAVSSRGRHTQSPPVPGRALDQPSQSWGRSCHSLLWAGLCALKRHTGVLIPVLYNVTTFGKRAAAHVKN